MNDLGSNQAAQKIVLAIDTAERKEAEKLAAVAQNGGGKYIKFGLQLSSAVSWQWCSELAKTHGLGWIADAKFNDIPNTVEQAVKSLIELEYPPFAITVHTSSGHEAMRRAQAAAGQIKVLGITVLTSLGDDDSRLIFGAPAERKVMQLAEAAADAGLAGIVASPNEVGAIKTHPKTGRLFTLIPGARSADTTVNDQARTATPAETVEAGADLVVIGREITQADDPAVAFAKISREIGKTHAE